MAELTKTQQEEVQKEVKKQISKKLIEKAHSFRSEYTKQVSTAVITSFGLVIALAWKDTITEFVKRVNPVADNLLISAVLVTAISIIGIAIISKWAKKHENSN